MDCTVQTHGTILRSLRFVLSPIVSERVCAWDPAAHCSKANKQARLVERKVCFISDAGNCGVEGWQAVQRPTPLSDKHGVRPCVCVRGGVATYRNISKSSSN